MKQLLQILTSIVFLLTFISCENEDETPQICINEEAKIKNQYALGERISMSSCSEESYRWVFYYNSKSDTLIGSSVDYVFEREDLLYIRVFHADKDEIRKDFTPKITITPPTVLKSGEGFYDEFSAVLNSEGNVILFGTFNTSEDFLMQLTSDMKPLDFITYKGMSFSSDYSLVETSFGYMVASPNTSNISALKLNNNFDEIDRNYEFVPGTYSTALVSAPEKKYFLSAYKKGQLNSGNKIHVLDQNGDLEITHTISSKYDSVAIRNIKRYNDKYYLLLHNLRDNKPIVMIMNEDLQIQEEFLLGMNSDIIYSKAPFYMVNENGFVVNTRIDDRIDAYSLNGELQWSRSSYDAVADAYFNTDNYMYYFFYEDGSLDIVDENGALVRNIQYYLRGDIKKVFFMNGYFYALGQQQNEMQYSLVYYKYDKDGALVLE